VEGWLRARLSRRRAVVDYFHRSKARQVGHARVGACQLDRCRDGEAEGSTTSDERGCLRRATVWECGADFGLGGDGLGRVVFGSGL